MGHVRHPVTPAWRFPTARQWTSDLMYRLNTTPIDVTTFTRHADPHANAELSAVLHAPAIDGSIDQFMLMDDGTTQGCKPLELPLPTVYELDHIRRRVNEATRLIKPFVMRHYGTRRMIEETLWYGHYYADHIDRPVTPLTQLVASTLDERISMWIKTIRNAATSDHRMLAAIGLKLLPKQAFMAIPGAKVDDAINALYHASSDTDGGVRIEATTALAKISRDFYLRNDHIIDDAVHAVVATMSDAKSSSSYGDWAVIQLIRGFEKLLSDPEYADEMMPALAPSNPSVAQGFTLLGGFMRFGPSNEVRVAAKTALDGIRRLRTPSPR